MAVNYFHKTFHRRCLTGVWMWLWFWIYQCSEYIGVLNRPGLLISQGSEYASGFEYVMVLDITQGSEYTWICQNNSWICLIMLECA